MARAATTSARRPRGGGRVEPGGGVRSLASLPRGDGRRAPARPRVRGLALGGRRAARLRRPTRGASAKRPAAPARDGAAGAAAATLRLGRRQVERAHGVVVTAVGRGDEEARRI